MKSELIKIILSLSPSERREFKLRYGTTSDFVKVLDYVVKYQSLDYGALGVFFEQNYPDRKTKFTSGYFSSIIAYLQDKVIDLVTQNERRTAYVDYTYHFQRFYALYNRGSILLADDEYNKCEVIAKKYNLIEEQLVLNRHKFMIYSFNRYATTSFEELKEINERTQELMRELALQQESIYVSSQSSLQYYLGTLNMEVMEMISKVSEQTPDSQNPWTVTLYNFTLANKRLLAGDFVGGFEIFEKSIWQCREERQMIELIPALFLIYAQFYLNWLMKTPTNKVDNRKSIDELFVFLTDEKAGFTLKKDIQVCDELLLIIKFWQMREDKQYESVTQQLTSADIEKYGDEHNKIHFVYQVAFSYFQLGLLDETLMLIDPLIDSDYEFKSNNDIFIKIMLLRILVYKTQNDDKFVLYLLRNGKYLFEKHGFQLEYEKLFLSIITTLISKKFEKNAAEIILKAQQKLEPFRQIEGDYLMLGEWLEKLNLQVKM